MLNIRPRVLWYICDDSMSLKFESWRIQRLYKMQKYFFFEMRIKTLHKMRLQMLYKQGVWNSYVIGCLMFCKELRLSHIKRNELWFRLNWLLCFYHEKWTLLWVKISFKKLHKLDRPFNLSCFHIFLCKVIGKKWSMDIIARWIGYHMFIM